MDVVEAIYYDIKEIALKVTGGDSLADDLTQEICLALYDKMDKTRSMSERGELLFYVVGMARRMWRSNTSEFRKKHIMKAEEIAMESIAYDDSYSFLPERIQTLIEEEKKNKRGWYDVNMLYYWQKYGTLREVSKQTGIPYRSVHLAIARLRKKIKEKLND